MTFQFVKALRGATAMLVLAAASALSQQSTGRVIGLVTDSATGAPVPNATVSIVGARSLTATGADGRFRLTGAPAGQQQLRVTRLGFAPVQVAVTVPADGDVERSIQMHVVAQALESQVVIGYGTQRRAEVTGAVASVVPDADQVPIRSIEEMLLGKVPGVQVTAASSEPGGGISIRVRGGSSITGNNEPLYVIDGFPVENDLEGSSPGNAGRDKTVPFNPLSTINPADIESIDILKDASATAIYGARGANGVVIITTKRGSGQKPRFTLDSYTGTQSVASKYDLLNGREFAEFVNAWGATQTPAVTPFTQAQIDSIGVGTDWQSQIFRNGAPLRNLQLGITGATAGLNPTKYALSGGVFDQNGVVRSSEFRRVSVRGAIDQSVGSRFHASSNISLARVATTAIPTNGGSNQSAGAIGAALQYYPTIPVRRSNGDYTLLAEDGQAILLPSTVPNPVSLVDDVTDKLGDTRMLANLFGEYKLADGLTLRVSGGSDYFARSRDTYYPRTTLQGRPVDGEARRGSNNAFTWLNENTLSFKRSFGGYGSMNSVVGYTRQKQTSNTVNMTNTNYVSDLTSFEDFGSGARPGGPSVSTGRTDWTFVSYLGRVSYTLMDRYIATVTERRDGSSRFGSGNKWGNFPSVGVAWWLSEEPWANHLPVFNSVKLRASWGIAGNPSIRPYQSLTHLGAQRYSFGGVASTGYYPSVLGNPDLSWETTEERDYGVDLGLFNGRIDITGDIYNKHTRDLLLARQLPLDAGFGTVLINAGSVKNTGQELGVTALILRDVANRFGVNWTSSVNYSRNRNTVLDIAGDTLLFAARASDDIGINGTIIKPGLPLGVFYGYQIGGILRSAQEATDYTAKVKPPTGTAWSAGDAYIIDIDTTGASKGVINAADRTIIGNPLPDFTIGWSNTVSFRGFDLNTAMEGSYGGTLLNLNTNRLESGSPRTNMLRDRWVDSWTPTNTEAAFPRIGGSLLNIGTDLTSDMLEDGSYTRLRNATLGYTVPQSWAQRGNLTSVRVYVTGTNLKTWTKYTGFNPDVSSISVGNVNRGIDIGAYPMSRAYTLGFNLIY